MTLTVILEHPDEGVVNAPVTGGTLDCQLDRYPRWSLSVDVRPALARGVELWETPYGTRAYVLKPDGSLLFTGHVHEARAAQPDGGWTLTAADPIILLSQYQFSQAPGQFLPGSTMSIPAFIAALALRIGVSVAVSGSGGTVDVRALDLAGKDAWRLVEEQLIANSLDVYPQPDGTLHVAPVSVLKESDFDKALRIGETGTITAWGVTMRRRVNRIVVTHQAQKQGQPDKYVDGIWEDHTGPSGIPNVGPVVHTELVRVGADWWDNPAGHQAQADANAYHAAQTLRGTARETSVDCIPDYTLRPGQTADIRFTTASRDRFLLTSVRWPLGGGEMTVTGRNPDPGRLYGGVDQQQQFFRTEPRRHHAGHNA